MFLSPFDIISWVSFTVLIAFYFSYFLVLHYYNSRKKVRVESPRVLHPSVSLIVPVYNEEKIATKKIQNIFELDYPRGKIETIFVDGCSTDNTAEVIRKYSQNNGSLFKLIRETKRGGYNSGMCEGILGSHGDIIVMSDAGAYYDPDALRCLVRHFVDPEVGAVTGKETVLGDPGALGPRLEATYRGFYDFMRAAETNMDSTPDSKGEILAVRRSICENLTRRIHLSPSASFDCCVPYQAKLDGYRTVFEPKAAYYEYAPSSFMDRMRQQIRRGAILVGSMLLFKDVLLNKKCGRFGLVIAPAHFMMQVVLPWLFGVGCVSLLIATFLNPLAMVSLWAVLLFVAVAASLKDRAFMLSFVQSQLALVIASLRIVARKNSVIIDTIPSTRK